MDEELLPSDVHCINSKDDGHLLESTHTHCVFIILMTYINMDDAITVRTARRRSCVVQDNGR